MSLTPITKPGRKNCPVALNGIDFIVAHIDKKPWEPPKSSPEVDRVAECAYQNARASLRRKLQEMNKVDDLRIAKLCSSR